MMLGFAWFQEDLTRADGTVLRKESISRFDDIPEVLEDGECVARMDTITRAEIISRAPKVVPCPSSPPEAE